MDIISTKAEAVETNEDHFAFVATFIVDTFLGLKRKVERSPSVVVGDDHILSEY